MSIINLAYRSYLSRGLVSYRKIFISASFIFWTISKLPSITLVIPFYYIELLTIYCPHYIYIISHTSHNLSYPIYLFSSFICTTHIPCIIIDQGFEVTVKLSGILRRKNPLISKYSQFSKISLYYGLLCIMDLFAGPAQCKRTYTELSSL